jgi:hypothetical protein
MLILQGLSSRFIGRLFLTNDNEGQVVRLTFVLIPPPKDGDPAQELLALDKGCKEFNTSFIERLNGTFRERLASLTRKCRHAAARVQTLERGKRNVPCWMYLQLLLSPS